MNGMRIVLSLCFVRQLHKDTHELSTHLATSIAMAWGEARTAIRLSHGSLRRLTEATHLPCTALGVCMQRAKEWRRITVEPSSCTARPQIVDGSRHIRRWVRCTRPEMEYSRTMRWSRKFGQVVKLIPIGW